MKKSQKHNYWTWKSAFKWALVVFVGGYLMGMIFASLLTAELYPTDDRFDFYYDPFIHGKFWHDAARILF